MGAAAAISEDPARIPVEVRDRGGLPSVLGSMPLAGWLRVPALWKPTRVRVGEPQALAVFGMSAPGFADCWDDPA